MIELLLTIIAACLLFGSAAVLGFLETAFWLLAAALIVSLVVWGIVALFRPESDPPYDEEAASRNRARQSAYWDDWIAESRKYREQWKQEQRERNRHVEIIPPSKFETVSELPPRNAPVSDWRIADNVTHGTLEEELRRLRAVSRELGKSAGRPLRPEMSAGVRCLLRENPDHREYILSELRRKGWRVEGL
jgi:hypothetical protein